MAPLNDVQATAFVTSLAITPVNIRRAVFEPLAITMGVLPCEMDEEYNRVVALMTPPRWDHVFLHHPRPLYACRSQHRNTMRPLF